MDIQHSTSTMLCCLGLAHPRPATPNESSPRPGSVSIIAVLVLNALRAGHNSILSVPPHLFRASKRRRCACVDLGRTMNSDASNSKASICRFDVGQPDPLTPNNVFLGSPGKASSEKKETCSCRGRIAPGWRCAKDRLCVCQSRAGFPGTLLSVSRDCDRTFNPAISIGLP